MGLLLTKSYSTVLITVNYGKHIMGVVLTLGLSVTEETRVIVRFRVWKNISERAEKDD